MFAAKGLISLSILCWISPWHPRKYKISELFSKKNAYVILYFVSKYYGAGGMALQLTLQTGFNILGVFVLLLPLSDTPSLYSPLNINLTSDNPSSTSEIKDSRKAYPKSIMSH